MFGRKVLIELREKSRNHANAEGLNPDWKRAYLRLADAADHLDAMIARCEVIPNPNHSEGGV